MLNIKHLNSNDVIYLNFAYLFKLKKAFICDLFDMFSFLSF